jgi:hypothetical protein
MVFRYLSVSEARVSTAFASAAAYMLRQLIIARPATDTALIDSAPMASLLLSGLNEIHNKPVSSGPVMLMALSAEKRSLSSEGPGVLIEASSLPNKSPQAFLRTARGVAESDVRFRAAARDARDKVVRDLVVRCLERLKSSAVQ